MKKLVIIGLLALMGNWATAYSQDQSSEVKELTVEQQQAVADIIAMDPKLSEAAIENIKSAIVGAPTKAEPIADPRMEKTEFVRAPNNAESIDARDDVNQNPIQQTSTQTAQSQTGQQPEPVKSDKKVIYQTNGSSEQNQPEKPGQDTRYRTVNGPQNQPDPKQPDGK